ncbi:MAG: hypothetical protein ACYC6M_04805 [Terriglobales bacterium]
MKLLLCNAVLALTLVAQTSATHAFNLAAPAEVLLHVTAAAEGTNWGEAGHEAAALRVLVDGVFHQNLVLFAGSTPFRYDVLLGRLPAGAHRISLERDSMQSSRSAGATHLAQLATTVVNPGQPEAEAVQHAPFLYARPNTIGQYSDIPLLLWYETRQEGANTVIQYSVIFTDEDGGTEASARVARWGRAADIEWIYQVTLDPHHQVVAEIYQGPQHHTHPFIGTHVDAHPLLVDATDNNNVSDRVSELVGERPTMRFGMAPFPFDLSHASREAVMDAHPWSYRIMAEEVTRQGKVSAHPGIGQGKIADPRNYLYLEASAQPTDAAMGFLAKFRGDPHWYSSDFGIGYFRIDRGGYFRSAIQVPPGTRWNNLQSLLVTCDAGFNPNLPRDAARVKNATCGPFAIDKLFRVDAAYRPRDLENRLAPQAELRLGETRELLVR